MANLLKIKQILNKKNLQVKALLDMVGITRQSLSDIYKNNSTKIETLEKISRALQVHPAIFFDEEFGRWTSDSNTNYGSGNCQNGNGHRQNGNGIIVGDVNVGGGDIERLRQENDELKAEVKQWQQLYVEVTRNR